MAPGLERALSLREGEEKGAPSQVHDWANDRLGACARLDSELYRIRHPILHSLPLLWRRSGQSQRLPNEADFSRYTSSARRRLSFTLTSHSLAVQSLVLYPPYYIYHYLIL
jgi:hypothetical protein